MIRRLRRIVIICTYTVPLNLDALGLGLGRAPRVAFNVRAAHRLALAESLVALGLALGVVVGQKLGVEDRLGRRPERERGQRRPGRRLGSGLRLMCSCAVDVPTADCVSGR